MKKSNLFFKWLFSYLWVLAFPLLFGIFLHISSLRTIREEANRLLSQDIEQDIQSIEEIFQTSQDICSTLLNLSMITSFAADPSEPDYALKEREIQGLLQHLRTANSTVHSIYLYYPQTGLFLGDSISLRSEDSNNLFRYRFALDREVLFDYINQSYPKQFYIIEEPIETSASLLYISSFSNLSSLSASSASGHNAVVLLLLKDSRIQQQIAAEEISILLEDRFGHTLTLNESLSPEALAAVDMLASANMPTSVNVPDSIGTRGSVKEPGSSGKPVSKTPALFQNKSYSIQARYQNFYTLYAITKNDRYLKKLQSSRRLLLFYILFCSAVGSVLAYALAKKQYSPVKELLQITSRASGEGSVLPTTEYDTIRESVQTLLRRYQEDQEQLQRQTIQLQSNSLAALLRSRHTSPQTDLGYYGRLSTSFSSERYLLFQFDLADIAGMEAADPARQTNIPAKTEDVLYFLLSNVIRDFLPEGTRLISSRIEDSFYFLMEAEASSDDTTISEKEQETTQTLRQIILFLQETYQTMIWGNISGIHTGLDGILSAYRELQLLTDYRNRIGSNQAVLQYSQIAAQPNILSQLELWEQEQIAVRYIENHQYEAAYSLLSDLSPHTETTPDENLASALNFSKSADFADSVDSMKSMDSVDSPGSIASSQSMDSLSGADARMQEVASYISQHYTDPQLSVASLAEEFHFSVSYLSRKFKEKRGTGILTYLNQLRLQRAKELLADGLSVTDTASAVGFYTTRPLLRLFRDEEGITPVEYQRQQREG